MSERIDHTYWAKEVLKYLVSHIKNFQGGDKFVYYGDLAKAIGYPEPYQGNVFARRIGETLGVMGHLIENIPVDGERPPYIQALVVSKSSRLPGDGIKEFYPDYPMLPREKKRDLVQREVQRVFEFGTRWEKLLEELNIPIGDKSETSQHSLHNPYGSEGSPEHRELRDYVYDHPEVVGQSYVVAKYREYPLKSGDVVDVLFETSEGIVAIEIKSRRSGKDDIERGIFQCVKYKAVLEAENIILEEQSPVDCILVLEESLPRGLNRVASQLQVSVLEGVKPSRTRA